MTITFSAVIAFIVILFWTAVLSKILSLVIGGGTSLVIKTLDLNKRLPTGLNHEIFVVGRREGLISFLLTLVGISPTTTLVVNKKELTCTTSGILGTGIRSISMDRIAQVVSGSKVAFEFILCSIITGVTGLGFLFQAFWNAEFLAIVGVIITTIVFIAISLLLFYLNKRFYVGVFGQGGWPILLVFKPNVIEGVELNLEKAIELSQVIQSLVVNAGLSQLKSGLTETPISQSDDDDIPIAVEELSDDPTKLFLEAQELIQRREREAAISKLQEVVDLFPGTREAEQAQRALKRAGVL